MLCETLANSLESSKDHRPRLANGFSHQDDTPRGRLIKRKTR
ncbi:MAG: hypothetical protein JWO94_1382 [Verrucomicrobiaceae bacterium]|nr:hypothetical protein [Verrucomicrobiaceae bacterium]